MKNTILLASLIAAGTAFTAIMLKRRRDARKVNQPLPYTKRSHHRTDVFAKAK